MDTLLRLWRVYSSPSVVNVSSSPSIDSQRSFVAVLRTPPSSSAARRWHGSESFLERLGSFFFLDTMKQSHKEVITVRNSKKKSFFFQKKQFIKTEDKLSMLPRRNPVNLETESISKQHCCSGRRHVKMVSSEALSMEDGQVRSSNSPSISTSAGMC